MLRAAAKNHQRVTVVTDPNDYDVIIHELNKSGKTSSMLRSQLALKVFKKISHYSRDLQLVESTINFCIFNKSFCIITG